MTFSPTSSGKPFPHFNYQRALLLPELLSYTILSRRAVSDLEALQVDDQHAFSTQLYINTETKDRRCISPLQPIIYYSAKMDYIQVNHSWTWLSFAVGGAPTNKAQSWQINKQIWDVGFPPIYRSSSLFNQFLATASTADISQELLKSKSNQ